MVLADQRAGAALVEAFQQGEYCLKDRVDYQNFQVYM